MFGKKSAIRKYKRKLGAELSNRYGGAASYTKAQVDVTVNDLRLNPRYIHYAYIMYCDYQAFDEKDFPEPVDSMNDTISSAMTGGIVATMFFGASYDGDSGGGFGGCGGGGE